MIRGFSIEIFRPSCVWVGIILVDERVIVRISKCNNSHTIGREGSVGFPKEMFNIYVEKVECHGHNQSQNDWISRVRSWQLQCNLSCGDVGKRSTRYRPLGDPWQYSSG